LASRSPAPPRDHRPDATACGLACGVAGGCSGSWNPPRRLSVTYPARCR
jgi:hypothetical protein